MAISNICVLRDAQMIWANSHFPSDFWWFRNYPPHFWPGKWPSCPTYQSLWNTVGNSICRSYSAILCIVLSMNNRLVLPFRWDEKLRKAGKCGEGAAFGLKCAAVASLDCKKDWAVWRVVFSRSRSEASRLHQSVGRHLEKGNIIHGSGFIAGLETAYRPQIRCVLLNACSASK